MSDFLPVLIVDDEPANLMAMEYQLKKNHYKVETAEEGFTALEMFEKNDYALVLLDVMMPKIDGFQVCQKMVELKGNVPIILITALSDDEHLQKGFDSGAWDYISKPWTEIQLISRIKKALKISLTEKQNLSLLRTLQEEFSKQNAELKLAGKVQKFLLPKWIHLKDDLIVSSVYTPSELLGGDIFDIISLKHNKHLIYVGDISGHGIQAALLMTAVKSIIRIIVEEFSDFDDLSYIIKRLNNILVQQMFQDKFLTLLFLIVDTKEKTINSFSAGHPPQIKIDFDSGVSSVVEDKGTLPLGWTYDLMLDSNDKNQKFNYALTDSYLIYTDGIYECLDKNNNFLGINGLNDKVKSMISDGDPVSIPAKLKHIIHKENYDLKKDDVAVLSISFLNKYEDFKGRIYFNYETNNDYEYKHQTEYLKSQLNEDVQNQTQIEKIYSVLINILNFYNQHAKSNNLTNDILFSVCIKNNKLIFELWQYTCEPDSEVIDKISEITEFSISSKKYDSLYHLIITFNI